MLRRITPKLGQVTRKDWIAAIIMAVVVFACSLFITMAIMVWIT